MKKVLAKLGFRNLSVSEKIQRARLIVGNLVKNEHFPSPNPGIGQITEVVNMLEAAYHAASDGSKTQQAIMDERETVLNELMANLALYVQNQSEGHEEKIRSTGFDVQADRTSIGELERPENLRAQISEHTGEIMLDWKNLHGAKAYIVEKSDDGSNGWAICGHCTASRMTITGLPAASYVWFRVAGVGAAGQSPWSDPVKGLIS